MAWTPNEATITAVENFKEVLKDRLPWILDLTEFITGCTVEDLDPESAGLNTWPRFIRAKIRGEYNVYAWYRTDDDLAVNDAIILVRFRGGEQYEIFGVDGSTGAGLAPGVSYANPTSQVGLSTVNGVLNTAMRSDGAPSLDQSITPTWTGLHTHDANILMTNWNQIDLNGDADLVWDADGDTLEFAAIDDKVVLWVGPVQESWRDVDGMHWLEGGDFYPDDEGHPIFKRITEYQEYVDHFRDASLLGWAGWPGTPNMWAGAPFNGFPASYDYDYLGTYVSAAAAIASQRYFLSHTVSNWDSNLPEYMYARVGCQENTRVGLRIDDTSDNNYRSVYLDPKATSPGHYDLVIKYRDGGGAVTTTTLVTNIQMLGEFVTIGMEFTDGGGEDPDFNTKVYLGMECVMNAYVGDLGGTATWTPDRAGIIFCEGHGTGTGTALADWYATDLDAS